MFQCPTIKPVCVDLSDLENTKKVVEGLGPIDLLVNNAGVYEEQLFVDIDLKAFDS